LKDGGVSSCHANAAKKERKKSLLYHVNHLQGHKKEVGEGEIFAHKGKNHALSASDPDIRTLKR